MADIKELLKDWEMQLVWEASFEDGYKKGIKLGIAECLLARGVASEMIVKATGLSNAEVEGLASPLLNNNEEVDDE
ncbi:MAG: hypothetical protein Q7U57_09325 [Methylovulum sp.]|nr:hypothetical protein [Methylovulum sp.]